MFFWLRKCCIYYFSDNKIDGCELGMYFTSDFEVLGKMEQFELKKGGADIEVTDENKQEYIQ